MKGKYEAVEARLGKPMAEILISAHAKSKTLAETAAALEISKATLGNWLLIAGLEYDRAKRQYVRREAVRP